MLRCIEVNSCSQPTRMVLDLKQKKKRIFFLNLNDQLITKCNSLTPSCTECIYSQRSLILVPLELSSLVRPYVACIELRFVLVVSIWIMNLPMCLGHPYQLWRPHPVDVLAKRKRDKDD